MDDKIVLRARDFWTALLLIIVSLFFLFETSEIPFLNTKVAGVDSADWYNSAALVPYGIFGGLLLLASVLLGISIKDGGAKYALRSVGLGVSTRELARIACISIILSSYIFGLVPRVDFIISSALLIVCLTWGFHSGDNLKMVFCASAMLIAAAYALIMHFPRSEWSKPLDDDWFALGVFLMTVLTIILIEYRRSTLPTINIATPIVAIFAPTVLVVAMAFGFGQNVPNRTGLLFSQIEYHYYVSLRPAWRGEQ